jgi:hypothetical protein
MERLFGGHQLQLQDMLAARSTLTPYEVMWEWGQLLKQLLKHARGLE